LAQAHLVELAVSSNQSLEALQRCVGFGVSDATVSGVAAPKTVTVTINSGVAGHWLRYDNPA
jgi:hypothetical protein